MTPEQYAMAQVRYAKYRAGEKYQIVQERFKATGGRNRNAIRHRAKVRATTPERYEAWMRLGIAVKRGDVLKPVTCQDCQREVRLDGHHHRGYTDALDVRWLCRRCHKAAHRKGVV